MPPVNPLPSVYEPPHALTDHPSRHIHMRPDYQWHPLPPPAPLLLGDGPTSEDGDANTAEIGDAPTAQDGDAPIAQDGDASTPPLVGSVALEEAT